MKYKLIAVDMDGTLLNSKSELTQRTREAIVKTVEAGALFIPSSGRPLLGLSEIDGLVSKDMPFITFNGASVVTSRSGEVIYDRLLDCGLVREVFEQGLARGYPMIVWTRERLWGSRECKETDFYRGYYDIGMSYVDDINIPGGEGVYKIIWITPASGSRIVQDEMNVHFNGRLNCFLSQPIFLEFVNNEADKGNALVEIGRRYGIDRGEMIAVGDGYNDISMMRYAGFSVAMGNAPDDIKAECDYVTSSNDEDGVAEVINKYILTSR